MSSPARRAGGAWDALAIAGVAVAAFAFTWIFLLPPVVPSADIYGAQYEMFAYAWRSLGSGHGLLWNRLQNCGQPFLPSTPPGTLYPLNALFLVFGLDRGWPAAAVLHLTIGGAGLFLLVRGYGVHRLPALCGAYVFALGGVAIDLAGWLPTANLGAYAWIPVALACVERLLEGPTLERALWLGGVLTLQLLAGSPQTSFFTYQVIALRLVWDLATAGAGQAGAKMRFLLLAAALPAALAAVSLLPSLEFSSLSVRGQSLSMKDLQPNGPLGWEGLRHQLVPIAFFGNRIATVGSLALAAAALALPGRRRIAIFYLGVLVLYLLLESNGTALALYTKLPMGAAFRFPDRFVYVIIFALSVLVALGAEALLEGGSYPGSRWLGLAAAAVGGLAFWALAAPLPVANPWVLLPVAVAPILIAATRGVARARVRLVAGLALAAVVLVDLCRAPLPFLTFHDDSLLWKHAAAFDFVKANMTPLDRMFQHADRLDFSVTQKSASLFDVPSIVDYEPLTSRRYADLYVMAAFNDELSSVTQFNFASPSPFVNRPLLNLLAARWLILSSTTPQLPSWIHQPYITRWRQDDVAVLENPAALPRAYYVPRLEVVPDARAVLARLASPTHEPRQVALVEEPPPDGFLGSEPPGQGTVSLVDRSERVTLDVTATQPGFVVLTDQYYPGWRATVDGVPTPILRANYAFRAVHVPPGRTVVEFRYRPRSVWLGAVISLTTLAGIAAVGTWRMRRRGAGEARRFPPSGGVIDHTSSDTWPQAL